MNIKENAVNGLRDIRHCAVRFVYWLVSAVFLGLVCGFFGAVFSKSVAAATSLRSEHCFLLLLLPAGGAVTVAIYKLFRVDGVGTNQVFESVRGEKRLSPLLAPSVFVGTLLTHLLGGSAGREGAALQLGGSLAELIGRMFHMKREDIRILTLCGMGAFFSAIFGTPLGACVFALEVVDVGMICSAAVFPALISSVTSYATALFFGVEPERFSVEALTGINATVFLKTAVIAVLGAAVSVMLCFALRTVHTLFEKYLKNAYLRAVIGGATVVLLTFISGSFDYNGSGMEVILRIFGGGSVSKAAFLLKMLFTVITVAAGFKGGEIIPTLFIGAALGATAAPLVGLSPAFAASVGMAALFCGATNCPIATTVLFAELFGGKNIIFIASAAAIAFFLSGKSSLYSEQRLIFSKFRNELSEKGKV